MTTFEAQDAQKTILDTIQALIERRDEVDVQPTPESHLFEDLGLDSLEVAELSAALEDELGHDPFSEGLVPSTVGELQEYYRR
jgi:acyl carrier protein